MLSTLELFPRIEELGTMKRQFQTLQSFQTLDIESNIMADDKVESEISTSRSDSVPQNVVGKRLLNNVKSVERRLTKRHLDSTDKEGSSTELQRTIQIYKNQLADQNALIVKLEKQINVMTGKMGGSHTLKQRAAVDGKVDLEANASGK